MIVRDTLFSNKLVDYIEIIEKAGFTKELEIPFEGRSYRGETPTKEKLYIYVKLDEGLLLCFDTFNESSVNGGKIYYNWKQDNGEASHWGLTSSGHFYDYDEDRIWVGDHDARESLLFKMEQMRLNGTFLPVWRDNPFIWLLSYADTDVPDYDYKKLNAERISMMRPEVQKMVGAE